MSDTYITTHGRRRTAPSNTRCETLQDCKPILQGRARSSCKESQESPDNAGVPDATEPYLRAPGLSSQHARYNHLSVQNPGFNWDDGRLQGCKGSNRSMPASLQASTRGAA